MQIHSQNITQSLFTANNCMNICTHIAVFIITPILQWITLQPPIHFYESTHLQWTQRMIQWVKAGKLTANKPTVERPRWLPIDYLHITSDQSLRMSILVRIMQRTPIWKSYLCRVLLSLISYYSSIWISFDNLEKKHFSIGLPTVKYNYISNNEGLWCFLQTWQLNSTISVLYFITADW